MDEWHKTENIYNFALSVLFIYLVADFALALNSARFFIQFYNCNFLLWNVQRWRNPIFFRSVCWVYRKLTIELLCVKDEIKRRQFAIWITNSESISNVEAHALHSHPLFSTRKYLFTGAFGIWSRNNKSRFFLDSSNRSQKKSVRLELVREKGDS